MGILQLRDPLVRPARGAGVMAYGLLLTVLSFFLGAWIAGLGCGL